MALQESEQNSEIMTRNAGDGRAAGATATLAPPPQRAVPTAQPPPGPHITPPEPPGPPGAKKKEDPEKEHKKRFRWFVIGLLILFAILLVVGIIPRLRAKPKLKKEAGQQSALPPVQVAYPQTAPPITTLELPGNIEALQQTDINARAQGFVKQWLVDIGDNVRAGQVLAILDTPDVEQDVEQARSQLAQARAALEEQRAQQAQAEANLSESRQNAIKQQAQVVQAKADLNLAYITWQRWNDLAKQGAVSQQAADEKQAAYNNNKANVASLQAAANAAVTDITAYQANVRAAVANVGAAKAQLEAGEANFRKNQVSQDFSKVRAPFPGVITNRSIDQGVLIGGAPSGGGGSFTVAANTPLSGGPNAGGSSSAQANGGGSQNLMYNSSADSATGGAASTGQPTGSSAATSTGGVPSSGSASGSNSMSGSATTSVFGSNGSTPVLPSGSSTSSSVAAMNAASKGGAPNRPATPPQAGAASTSVAPARAPYGSGSGSAASAGGTVVSPGTSLYTLARIDIMRIQVNVPQAYAPNVRAGQKAQILLREYPNQKFIGTVTRTARSIDPQARTMLTEIQIRNTKKLLLPGMYAQIVFQIPRSGQALLIPTSALINDSRGSLVATVGGNNKVHLNPVQLGRDYGQTIEVVSGIDARALIVTSPSDTTTEGAPAKAVFAAPSASSGSVGGSGGGSTGGASSQNSGGVTAGKNEGSDGQNHGADTTGIDSGNNSGKSGLKEPPMEKKGGDAGNPSSGNGNEPGNDGGRRGGNGPSGSGSGNGGAAGGPPPNLGQSYGTSKG